MEGTDIDAAEAAESLKRVGCRPEEEINIIRIKELPRNRHSCEQRE